VPAISAVAPAGGGCSAPAAHGSATMRGSAGSPAGGDPGGGPVASTARSQAIVRPSRSASHAASPHGATAATSPVTRRSALPRVRRATASSSSSRR
jgi:hypothetical protein